jgi:hypothetical protein
VRANLKEPLSSACIEQTLHKLPEIDRIAIHKSTSLREASRPEQVPAQYMFEGGPNKGLITQFQTQEGRTSFLSGADAMGVTAEDQVERLQLFNARIAIQVAQACHARFVDASPFICFPDRAACRQVLQNQVSK